MAKFLSLCLCYTNVKSRSVFTHKVRTLNTYSIVKTEYIGFSQLPLTEAYRDLRQLYNSKFRSARTDILRDPLCCKCRLAEV